MLKRVHTTKLMEPSMVITSRGAQIFRIIQIDSEELHRWKLKKQEITGYEYQHSRITDTLW